MNLFLSSYRVYFMEFPCSQSVIYPPLGRCTQSCLPLNIFGFTISSFLSESPGCSFEDSSLSDNRRVDSQMTASSGHFVSSTRGQGLC